MTDAVSASAPLVPTSHDRSFIPYPLGLDPRFEACLPDTLVEEGGYSNDAHDPGGMTMRGIIQREYDAKRKQWGLRTQWVKNITVEEYRSIYSTDYWMPYCPKLPSGLDLNFFDLDVNGGPHRAVITLQMALGFTGKDVDGQWGPQTDAAVNAVKAAGHATTVMTIDNYVKAREAFYRSLGTFQFFGGDWIRRSENMDREGDAMVA
jgi:lysozyme family protein